MAFFFLQGEGGGLKRITMTRIKIHKPGVTLLQKLSQSAVWISGVSQLLGGGLANLLNECKTL